MLSDAASSRRETSTSPVPKYISRGGDTFSPMVRSLTIISTDGENEHPHHNIGRCLIIAGACTPLVIPIHGVLPDRPLRHHVSSPAGTSFVVIMRLPVPLTVVLTALLSQVATVWETRHLSPWDYEKPTTISVSRLEKFCQLRLGVVVLRLEQHYSPAFRSDTTKEGQGHRPTPLDVHQRRQNINISFTPVHDLGYPSHLHQTRFRGKYHPP